MSMDLYVYRLFDTLFDTLMLTVAVTCPVTQSAMEFYSGIGNKQPCAIR